MAYILLLLYAAIVFLTIKTKNTFTPMGAMVFLWAGLNVVLLAFARDMVIIKYTGLLYIFISVAVFVAGYLIACKTAKPCKEPDTLFFNTKFITPLLITFIVLGFVNPLYYMYSNGFTISHLFDAEELGIMTKQFSSDRNYGDTNVGYSKFVQLFLIITYVATIMGGFCWLASKGFLQKLLCILTVFPCLLITLSQSTKMPTMVALIFWVSGLLVYAFSFDIKIKLSVKSVIAIVVVGVLFFVGMFFSMLTRWGAKIDDKSIERNKTSFFDYALGSPLCFDDWFYRKFNNINYSTAILQTARIQRHGFFHDIEDGSRVDFNPMISIPNLELYGARYLFCNFEEGKTYTFQFVIGCNVKPDSVKVKFLSTPKGKTLVDSVSTEQRIGLNKWLYTKTFTSEEDRLMVRLPDVILSVDSAKYVEITKFRVDTGAVALPWDRNNSNIYWYNDDLLYGFQTFNAIPNALGITRMSGIYRDFVFFGRLNKAMSSNVYTIFRMLIDDFGMYGALVFMLLLGFASGKAVEMIKKRKMLFVCQAFLVAVYAYIIWGFVASIWAYTSIVAAFGFSFFMFSILQKPLHGETWVTKITNKLKPKKK